ncbi:MAG: hypothetical protein ACYCZ1_08155 [Candidatus Humimicrobiaceae bacterium]
MFIFKIFIVEIKAKSEIRSSGYKSIHYLAKLKYTDKYYYIEIQLRTLFQDVWSELEHTLVYKKSNVNEYIRESFGLLAQNLKTNDELISNLKDISDKEKKLQKYLLENSGPLKFLHYESEFISESFNINSDLKNTYDTYINFVSQQKPNKNVKNWIKDARSLYKKIKKCITVEQREEDPLLDYFLDMEEGFLCFCEGKYEKAEEIYNTQKSKHPNHYVIHFRIGELFLLDREMEKAFSNFDFCENIIEEIISKKIKVHPENLYRIKVKIAYTYLSSGKEFIDFAIDKIEEAQKILQNNRNYFDDIDYLNLLNNIVTCYLDKYIILNEQKKVIKDKNSDIYKSIFSSIGKISELIVKKVELLENQSGKLEAPSNVFDTLAWYYFQMYLNDRDSDLLKKAQQYCKEIYGKLNYSPFILESSNLHLKHIQEIMMAH